MNRLFTKRSSYIIALAWKRNIYNPYFKNFILTLELFQGCRDLSLQDYGVLFDNPINKNNMFYKSASCKVVSLLINDTKL